MITNGIWNEEQRIQYGSRLSPALVKHLEDQHGSDNQITKTFEVTVVTARKPL
jgi:hypothetical protein